jgi:hypothetical protein
MSAELNAIKKELSDGILKQKSKVVVYEANEKMYYLEQERDFFRNEVTKMNEEVRRYEVENKKIKTQLS